MKYRTRNSISCKVVHVNQEYGWHSKYVGTRLVPIMLLKLPIILWSNAPIFFLLCSNYAP